MYKPIPVCKIGIVHKDRVQSAMRSIKNKEKIFRTSETFKVLSDPNRLKIVIALAKEELCVCDIAALLNLTESAVSHQLRILKNTRIVRYKKIGKLVYYSLTDKHIESLIKAATEHIKE